jgi:hypothetical protein
LSNFFCLVKISSVNTPLLGAPLFVRGYPASPIAYFQQSAILSMGVLAAVQTFINNNTLFSISARRNEPVRDGGPVAVVVAS